MPNLIERLSGFRFIDPHFDGNTVLSKYFGKGNWVESVESDMEAIRKDSMELASDTEAVNFLNGEDDLIGRSGSP